MAVLLTPMHSHKKEVIDNWISYCAHAKTVHVCLCTYVCVCVEISIIIIEQQNSAITYKIMPTENIA